MQRAVVTVTAVWDKFAISIVPNMNSFDYREKENVRHEPAVSNMSFIAGTNNK